MKYFLLLFLMVAGIFICASWKSQSQSQIKKTEWLLGTWENITQRGSVFETWSHVSEYEMYGKSYTISDNDTLLFEEIQLIQEQDSLFYIPTVSNQNDGMPVQFALVSITDTSMTFKHPYHDFPQVISYARIGIDSLNATISGLRNGQHHRILFPMKRVSQ